MSAPDPKAWAASQWEVMSVSPEGRGDDPEVIELTAAVARRRAIAELKALRDETCTWCCTGEAFDENLEIHRDTEGDFRALCDAEHVRRRIAAIEAESD